MGKPRLTDAGTPSHAERCRTLLARSRHGTLSTIARDPEGFPFGTLVALASDTVGRPLLLLSGLAEHTQNLIVSPRASILVAASVSGRGPTDPLGQPRATIVGTCARIADEAVAEHAREIFLSAHPEASTYASFRDFAMYRLEPAGARYVGGFGRMSWIDAGAYRAAEPDPLALAEADMLEHMNEDHPDAVLAYARAFTGIDGATRALMTAIDRYGFELLMITEQGDKVERVAFTAQVTSKDDARRVLIEMVRDARASLSAR